jgi:kynureninase
MYQYSTSYIASQSFAANMDVNDPLAPFKSQFHFPKHDGNDVIYFCGNSLGLQPKNVAAAIAPIHGLITRNIPGPHWQA